MFGRGLAIAMLLTAFIASAAPPAAAQSTLADGSCVVVTSEGLFLVVDQDTVQVFDTTPFGGNLNSPSVTWIDGTDRFIVTTLGTPGAPGIYRVTLAPNGTGSVQNLTFFLPPGVDADFNDADYAPGLDLMFLLQREAGRVFAWAKPAQASLATLESWGTVPPDLARSMAVNGSAQPFAVAVVLENGPVLRVDKLGTHELYPSGSWNDIVGNPVSGALVVAKQVGSLIGQIASPSLLIDFNVSGFCGPLVPQPSDVEWDAILGRAVAIAAEEMQPCAFGGGVLGTNHIVRLPLTAGGGPPGGNQPVLLTPQGLSGITGNRADFALVRHGASEVTYWGWPGAGSGTSKPSFEHEGPLALGKAALLKLAKAPPAAAALLAIGLHPHPIVFQGQSFMPAPDFLLPAVTSANGASQLALKLPKDATALVGLEFYMQWVVDDTTTAVAGDIASSQAAVFTVGLK